MGLIHRTVVVTEKRVHRDPLILKKKMEFIRRNRAEFKYIFITDYAWRHKKKWGDNNWSMKSKMASVMKYCYGPRGVKMAERIRERFGYNELTSQDTILFTWRRLYMKMYHGGKWKV